MKCFQVQPLPAYVFGNLNWFRILFIIHKFVGHHVSLFTSSVHIRSISWTLFSSTVRITFCGEEDLPGWGDGVGWHFDLTDVILSHFSRCNRSSDLMQTFTTKGWPTGCNLEISIFLHTLQAWRLLSMAGVRTKLLRLIPVTTPQMLHLRHHTFWKWSDVACDCTSDEPCWSAQSGCEAAYLPCMYILLFMSWWKQFL